MKKEAIGYISLHKQILDHWLWDSSVKSKFEAWTFMLLRANWKDAKIPVGKNFIEIKRGEFFTSQEQLSKAFRWDRNKVRSFLELLRKDNMITSEVTTNYTKITICNYDSYQEITPAKNQRNTNDLPSENQRPPTTNKDKYTLTEYISDAIDFLNQITGKQFEKGTKSTVSFLTARFKENRTIEELKLVVQSKYNEWTNNPEMSKYIQPDTLFGNKFANYLANAKPLKIVHAKEEIDFDDYTRPYLNRTS